MLSTWKAPDDVFDYSMDFTPTLVAGEALSSIESVTSYELSTGADSTSSLIGSPTPSIDGNSVIFWMKGTQTLGEHHRVLVEVETDAGRIYTGALNVDILET